MHIITSEQIRELVNRFLIWIPKAHKDYDFVDNLLDSLEEVQPLRIVCDALWEQMCEHDGLDPGMGIIPCQAFSDDNPYIYPYHQFMDKCKPKEEQK